MLGGGEIVAVENPDSVARKQRGQGGDHRCDDRLHPFYRGADQRSREDRFEVVSLLSTDLIATPMVSARA